MSSPGRFAGKLVFGSTQDGGPVYYLTTWTVKRGDANLQLPAMRATTVTDGERCLLYAQGDGSVRIQLGSLLWISLDPRLGWLQLTADPALAAGFVLGGNPAGHAWQVQTSSGLATVVYTVGNASPILTINDGPGALTAFAPTLITPSLEQILTRKACPGGDFRWVDLQGQSLSGVDLTGAHFDNGNLSQAEFTGATLTGATFTEAVLAGITCDRAVLDGADFTRAHLVGVAWGRPASAAGVILTGCSAQGAVLGGQSQPLDCTGASLATGDFRGADLRGLLLTGAKAAGALLAGCHLDKAVLDNADLQGAVLAGATLRGASLKGVHAQNASFVRADLSGAHLDRAKMGARAYLFGLASSYATELDKMPYVKPDLLAAFAAQGVTLSPEDPVAVLTPGQRWQIQDTNGPYLLVSGAGGIDVFWIRPDLTPAVLRGAICQGTTASGASLSGADLRCVQWYGQGATLDHADLEGATLAGSLLAQTDFTQAHLNGADLSDCVLVQASLRGCLIGPGLSHQPFSLEGSLLQGVDFTDATLLSALLVDAAVALPQGVPLFTLPASSEADLTNAKLQALAPDFANAGYPLGATATVAQVSVWFIDNSADPDPSSPSLYRLQSAAGQLRVFDGQAGTFLFQLPPGDVALLSGATAPPALVAAFGNAGYSLAAAAGITTQAYWEIAAGSDAPHTRAITYPLLRVHPGAQRLTVYGSVLVQVPAWRQFQNGLAFSATTSLEAALNPASLGPSGYPRSWVDQGLLDWQMLMTARVVP